MDWLLYGVLFFMAFYMVNVLVVLSKIQDRADQSERHARRMIEILEGIEFITEQWPDERRQVLAKGAGASEPLSGQGYSCYFNRSHNRQ